MVVETSRPIARVAADLGINEGTLGNWVNAYRREHPQEDEPMTPAERAKMLELQAENRELRMELEFLKSRGVLRPGVAPREKYAFIRSQAGSYPVTKMCPWLEVSRSGYYEWRDRPVSPSQRRRERLAALIKALFDAHEQRYGHRRIHAELLRRRVPCSPELVADIMRELGLRACQPRAYRVTTVPADDPVQDVPDLLERDFAADRPGTKLVGDITYIRTWQGWVYLATVIDCATKMVVGWSMAEHMRTTLVTSALGMARGRIDIQDGCIFHSDRGTQYLSAEYREYIRQAGMRSSVGRTGVCWDNAMAESFFAALKNELVHRTAFPTRDHAHRAIADYIEVFYNRRRIHSGLGYRTPAEVLNELLGTQQAA